MVSIVIVDSQFPNVFIKLNGMALVLFRLFHASLDAGVAGQCERNHGNVGMYRCARSRMTSAFASTSYMAAKKWDFRDHPSDEEAKSEPKL